MYVFYFFVTKEISTLKHKFSSSGQCVTINLVFKFWMIDQPIEKQYLKMWIDIDYLRTHMMRKLNFKVGHSLTICNFEEIFWRIYLIFQESYLWQRFAMAECTYITKHCVKYLSHWWVEMDDELSWICLQLSFLIKCY